MNKKGFANIVLIALVAVFIGAVGYFAFRKSPPRELSLDQSRELSLDQLVEACYQRCPQSMVVCSREECYSQVATDLKDASVCDNISDELIKTSCLFNVGIETNDESVCKKIKDADSKGYCLNHAGMVKEDVSICMDALGIFADGIDYGELCLEGLARKMNDIKICDLIKIPNSTRNDQIINLCREKFNSADFNPK